MIGINSFGEINENSDQYINRANQERAWNCFFGAANDIEFEDHETRQIFFEHNEGLLLPLWPSQFTKKEGTFFLDFV